MATKQTTMADMPDNQRSMVVAGYQAAVTLWTQEKAVNWSRFNVTLIANTILITVLGIIFSNSGGGVIGSFILTVIGGVVCAIWFLLTRRSFEQQNYYLSSAREIEEKYLADSILTLSRGETFASGEKVTLTLNGKAQTVQMGALAGVFTPEIGALVMIGIIGGGYVLFALLTVINMVNGVMY